VSIERAGEPWTAVGQELTHWRAAGRQAQLWLRDDDAVAPTPALDRLLAIGRAYQVPILIAVIPMLAERSLAIRLANEPVVFAATHGIRHDNHAPSGRKSEETPLERGEHAIMEALHKASARMKVLFGAGAASRYVPPWNRLPTEMREWLPKAGFDWISAFASTPVIAGPLLRQANAHVDLIDWKNGRVGRSEVWMAAALAAALREARIDGFRPVGILTHHLVHDEQAWLTLGGLMTFSRNAGIDWVSPPFIGADRQS
jgi:peptidoglycan/xylan/chitin deacetylase (PgdA/CDA1 family)